MTADDDVQVLQADRIDFGSMVDGLRRAGAQFVSLVRELDAGAAGQMVPNMTWTAAETAVHMFTIVRRGTDDMRRSDSIPGLASLNDQCINEIDTREPTAIADMIENELARVTRALSKMDAATAEAIPFPLHAGLTTNVPSALSYVLFDFLAHGFDIARATGCEWTIPSDLAALDLHAILPIIGPWVTGAVRNGPRQEVTISFPDDGDAIALRAGEGEYVAQNVERSVAGVEEVDPVDAFLTLAGRSTSPSPVVTRLAGWFDPI